MDPDVEEVPRASLFRFDGACHRVSTNLPFKYPQALCPLTLKTDNWMLRMYQCYKTFFQYKTFSSKNGTMFKTLHYIRKLQN